MNDVVALAASQILRHAAVSIACADIGRYVVQQMLQHVAQILRPAQLFSDQAGAAGIAYIFHSVRYFAHGDRKSVVWGKSMSVRVDIGRRLIIKKNKNSTSIRSNTETKTY